METVAGSWLFAVFICIIVLILVINLIREFRDRRNNPTNPEDKRLTRKLALEILKFLLGIEKKSEEDNPGKFKEEDGGFL